MRVDPATEDSIPARNLPVDLIKAVGILVVVLIHSFRAPWDPAVAPLELWLARMTRFAVPGFLTVSGFLYATTGRVGWVKTRHRFRRLLPPYLVASIGAQLFWWSQGPKAHDSSILTDLIFCSSFGPYYYVFLIICFVLLTPLVARLPKTYFAILIGATLVYQGMMEAVGLPSREWLFWWVRNPLLYAAYFLLGWCVRLHYASIRAWVTNRRPWLVTAAVLAIVVCGLIQLSPPSKMVSATVTWLNIYAVLTLVFVSSCGRFTSSAVVRNLSDATYSIYLFHLFFIEVAHNYFKSPRNELDLVALFLTWGTALAGSISIVIVARFFLGTKSRDAVGA